MNLRSMAHDFGFLFSRATLMLQRNWPRAPSMLAILFLKLTSVITYRNATTKGSLSKI